MKVLALVLACNLWVSSAFGQESADRQIAQVKADFASTSLAKFQADLARIRPNRVGASDKQILLQDLPLLSQSNRITDRRQLDRLATRLRPVLELHDRAGAVELIVFRDSRPIVYNKPGVVIVFATGFLELVGDDDAALVGVVAHELAHEYIAMAMLGAIKANDQAKLRRLELFCDAIAVATLLNLHLDPVRFSNMLKRICTHSEAAAELNAGSYSHPALAVRLKLITEIQAQLQH